MKEEWSVVLTETEILGGVDESPTVSIVNFSKINKAKDFMRKSFTTVCSNIVGLCYAKYDENTMTAKILGECTVVTIGVRQADAGAEEGV